MKTLFLRSAVALCALVLPVQAATFADITSQATASQSHSHTSGDFPASNALDGDINTTTHTESQTPGGALYIDFAVDERISEVRIFPRNGCCGGRLNGAKMRLIDSEDDQTFIIDIVDPGPGEELLITIPGEGVLARRIEIGFEPTQTGIVNIAEVRVSGAAIEPPEIEFFTKTELAGGDVRLEWNVNNADIITLQGQGTVAASGSIIVNPASSSIYVLVAENECGAEFASHTEEVGGEAIGLLINEFVADDPGDPDWVEIWNPSSDPIDLTGYHLTDDPDNLTKFALPAQTLPGSSIITFDDPFGISTNAGEYLALVAPDGSIAHEYTYPEQFKLVSYGLTLDLQPSYFTEFTKGSLNLAPTTLGVLDGVEFSHKRGFYEDDFSLLLEPRTPGATVYYTLDSTTPTATTGIQYTGSISVTTTTVVRAIEHMTGFVPSETKANTYLFLDDVVQQAEFPSGFPTQWQPEGRDGALDPIPRLSDYEMDPRVSQGGPYTDQNGESFTTQDALKSIPTLCIALPNDDMWDFGVGIHFNSNERGRDWEKFASFEYFDPRNGDDFETGIGLRLHGGRSRVQEIMKKSFRLYFRASYGDSSLQEEIFKVSPQEGFDHIVLRGGTGQAWVATHVREAGHERVTYLRDEFHRRCFEDMGNLSIGGSFVHLYINGLYWGLYNAVERPGADQPANHLNHDRDDYDVIKLANQRLSAADGTVDRWEDLLALAEQTLTDARYEEITQLVDIDNLIDYMLTNFYVGNQDWITNNGYGYSRRIGDDVRWRFLPWDGEESFRNLTQNSVTSNNGRDPSIAPLGLHRNLRNHPEYRLRFADRTYKHLIDEGGELTPEGASARMENLVREIDRAIVGESARWGDLLRPQLPYTRENSWLNEVELQRSTYLTQRSGITFSQIRNRGLYPSVDPPQATLLAGQNSLQLEPPPSPTGTLYYTLDGSDPRLSGGAVANNALIFDGSSQTDILVDTGETQWSYLNNDVDLGPSNQDPTTAWFGTSFDDSAWAQGLAPLGNGNINDTTLNTLINLGDDGDRTPTIYFRTSFDVDDASLVNTAAASIMVDDAVVLYLNGTEIFRSTNLPSGAITFQTFATSGATEGVYTNISVPTNLLQTGTNVLAAEVHQRSSSSSDLGFDTIFSVTHDTDPDNAIVLAQDTLVKARFRSSTGEWSAMEEEFFEISDPSQSLVISKIMFNPRDPDAADISAGFISAKDFEYMEVTNVGAFGVSTTGLRFTKGADYTFPSGMVINPGQRVVIAANAAAFAHRYGTVGDGVLFGTWEAGDSLNNGGERIRLVNADTETIRDFEYDNVAPWPNTVEETGLALTLRRPETVPDHSLGLNWRASRIADSIPGVDDRRTYDIGSGGLLGYLTGSEQPQMIVQGLADGTYSIGIERDLSAEDGDLVLERSTTMMPDSWTELPGLPEQNVIRTDDGRDIVIYRDPAMLDADKAFYRFRPQTRD